ncbi:hypothetical protein JVT61DRAFT_2207 [Boletus reticuloceps]|uniref:Uncharacterized protein n=1 Tax=Boletus reticuloceps TaxID=495285 RepID=A0A8I2YRT2_9AGAM|nr:hypothetical protein JVT61DRAFT_2207 [Boletus reticuloceps]
MDDDDYSDLLALLDHDDTASIDRTAPIDRLGPAFAAHRRHGIDHIKHAFIPIVHHTKQLHDAIRDDIFPMRTLTLARLDEATLHFENAARRDMHAAQSAYDDSKRALDALFSTLDDLVCQSDHLFQTFETSMLEHVQRLRHCADQMPVDAERLITSLDNKAKHLGAQDHAKAKENLLRGILEKY